MKLRSMASMMAIGAVVLTVPALGSAVTAVPDAFTPESYWNTPVGPDAVRHPNSAAIIDFLARDNALGGCITLAGHPGNRWGMPVFVATAADPTYAVASDKWAVPTEFGSLRIPRGAVAADNSDGEMVVYDMVARLVAQLSKARYDASTDTWTVSGGSVAYLDSNGLDGSLPESDDPRNRGTFRGYPGAVAMVHYDDVASGGLDNVVKIGVNNANAGFVFPMIGSDGSTNDPNAPLEGTRIRVRPDVNLESLGLSGQALVIAQGLQKYGMIVGDNTGGSVVLMLEDTVAGGRGSLWDLNRESLCAIKPHHLEVLSHPGGPGVVSDPGGQAVPASGFTDVPAGHAFESEIIWLAERGITKGCHATRFCPEETVTRGQMAVFLTRALNLPVAPSAGFTDTLGHPYASEIDSLFASRVTIGCAADRFCPETTLTRAQMAAFLSRAFNLADGPSAGFVDTSGHPFEVEIDRLAAAGITRGCTFATFCPESGITRGQMAALLRRALEG